MWCRLIKVTTFFSFCIIRTSSFFNLPNHVVEKRDYSFSNRAPVKSSSSLPNTGAVSSPAPSDFSSNCIVISRPNDSSVDQDFSCKMSVRIAPIVMPLVPHELPNLFTESQVKEIFSEYKKESKSGSFPFFVLLSSKKMSPLSFWRTLIALKRSGKDYSLSVILSVKEINLFYNTVEHELALEKTIKK